MEHHSLCCSSVLGVWLYCTCLPAYPARSAHTANPLQGFTVAVFGVSTQATNRRTLGAMVKEMGKGGKLVWIAPSGGRDRPDPQTGDWLPHSYDPGTHLHFS